MESLGSQAKERSKQAYANTEGRPRQDAASLAKREGVMTIGINMIKIGDKVLLLEPHPWAGHAGEFIRMELIQTLQITRPVVRLDNGQECFVTRLDQWQKVG